MTEKGWKYSSGKEGGGDKEDWGHSTPILVRQGGDTAFCGFYGILGLRHSLVSEAIWRHCTDQPNQMQAEPSSAGFGPKPEVGIGLYFRKVSCDSSRAGQSFT